LLGAACGAARAQNASPEEAVKATFLYRFASFVDWPPGTFSADDAPIRLCVAGAEPLRSAAASQANGQVINGRPIQIVRLSSSLNAPQCHVLYAAGALSDDALRAVRQLPVLTVTDAATGANARGVIHFAVVDNRVRFHIDEAQAAENGLTISSRLLSVALSVRRAGS
jgi:hypothetical protein